MRTKHALGWLYLIGLTVTVTFVSAAPSSDPCDREEADGCSSPFHMNFPFKTEFTPSCNRHDTCYSCAVAFGLTREDCDRSFLRDLTQVCKSISMGVSSDGELKAKQTETSKEDLEKHRQACQSLKAKEMSGEEIDCDRDDFEYLKCLGMADTAFGAVRMFGAYHFENTPLSFCDKCFVKSCLPEST